MPIIPRCATCNQELSPENDHVHCDGCGKALGPDDNVHAGNFGRLGAPLSRTTQQAFCDDCLDEKSNEQFDATMKIAMGKIAMTQNVQSDDGVHVHVKLGPMGAFEVRYNRQTEGWMVSVREDLPHRQIGQVQVGKVIGQYQGVGAAEFMANAEKALQIRGSLPSASWWSRKMAEPGSDPEGTDQAFRSMIPNRIKRAKR